MNIIVHEPEVRRREGVWYKPDPIEQQSLLDSLATQVLGMDFTVIAAVIGKHEYWRRYGSSPVDEFLPRNHYLMCIDFIMERFVHFLFHRGNDAWGRVFAEARRRVEDVRVQVEYVRLQLDGTRFSADQTFRYHLGPTIEFLDTAENHSGLQIADLLARPVAERLLRSDIEPARWSCVVGKLYDGCTGEPHKYGLKAFPAHSLDAMLN